MPYNRFVTYGSAHAFDLGRLDGALFPSVPRAATRCRRRPVRADGGAMTAPVLAWLFGSGLGPARRRQLTAGGGL